MPVVGVCGVTSSVVGVRGVASAVACSLGPGKRLGAAETTALALMYSEGREMGRSSTWLILAGCGGSGGIEVCRSCGDCCGLNDRLEGLEECFASLCSTAAGLDRSLALFVVLLTRFRMLLIRSCNSSRALSTLSARCTWKHNFSTGSG